MTIDKIWMSVTNRISLEYKNGVRMFVARAIEYADEDGKIRCPCNTCLNHLYEPLRLVEIHLIKYGIQQSYKVRDYHGEQYEHPPTEHGVLSDSDVQDEMKDILADLTGPVEMGEPSEPIRHQGLQTENFDDMLKEIEKELYLGCVNFSALKEKSEKNTNNRFCSPFEGAHGSKTLVQYYHAVADPVTGELPSVIDTFEKLFHKGGEWKNDWAAQKYAEMVKVRSTQPEGEGSVSTIDNVHQPKDIDIMTQVLGSRSRYVKGLGPLPKLSIVGGPKATNISLKHNDDGEKIMVMQQMIDEQKRTIGEQQQRFDALLQQLQQVIPGFSFQPPPTDSST